jgi:scyllo-inositol 2-dehydrogenase (NADP+)
MGSFPVRAAVIGYGLGGRVFHCPFISAVPELELAAIVQRSGDDAGLAYPNSRILRSIDETLSDSTIDLVVVSTPNDTHFDLAKQALQAGKHVVIDKPFAPNSEAALELIKLAEAQGKLVIPFHNRRFDGDFLTVGRLIDEKMLGRVVQVISHFDRFRPVQRPNTWKEASGISNGMLFDLGPHLIDQALALFGAPDTITASVRRDRDRTDIDDAFDVVLEYKASGVRYECHASYLACEPSPRFLLHGTQGSYIKHGLDPQEPAIVGGARPPAVDSTEPWLPEPESAWGTIVLAPNPEIPTTLERSPCPTVMGDYRLFYENVRDAVLGKAALAVTPQDGYRTIKLIELAMQSSHEGRTLPVSFKR